LSYSDSKNVTIRFLKTGFITNVFAKHVRDGQIKDPFYPYVFNVGFLGVGRHNSTDGGRKTTKYSRWTSMLQRCYSEEHQSKHPAYIGCSVAPEWHNFQNFGNWFDENYVEGWHIDKDILVKGNKVYSPDNCCYVPKEINELFTKTNALRADLPIGVSFDEKKKKYKSSLKINSKSIHLGNFDTPEEAFVAYKKEKEKNIKHIANEWKNKISEKVYKILIDYQVEIND
jgi:hypothetical protein